MRWLKKTFLTSKKLSNKNDNSVANEWHFKCETREKIPLPPDYTFPQAFNYLNEDNNSFYSLTSPQQDYIQCGGGRKRCTVEMRLHDGKSHAHYVVGKDSPSDVMVEIQMRHGPVKVYENEVLSRWDAIELFDCFFKGQALPTDYKLRPVALYTGSGV